ncbi:MAG: hypothetical protein ACRDRH_05330 [Pseudonocardia sp.]
MTDDDDPIVVFMARQPELLRRLLDEHVDDGTGHCRVCAIGDQAGYRTWPCNIAGYMIRAAQIRPPPDPVVERQPGAPRPRVLRVGRARAAPWADDKRGRPPGTRRK